MLEKWFNATVAQRFCTPHNSETDSEFRKSITPPNQQPTKLLRTTMNSVPMTRAAYDRKRAEVELMEGDQMSSITEKIAEARAEGDLKENAEYHAQREAQGLLQAKINQIKGELSRAQIIDMANVPRDEVAFGATVKVLDLDLDDDEEMTLVGAGDEDYDLGKYLITSPIGQGLLGSKIDDVVEIDVPAGTMRFKILEIRYE